MSLNISGCFLFLLAWQVFNVFFKNDFIPSPIEVIAAFYKEAISGMLLRNLLCSFKHIFYGCLFGLPIGIALGTFSALSPKFSAITSWVFSLARPIPPIAWIPIVIGSFGIDSKSSAIIIAIGVVWTVYYSTMAGINAVEYQYLELGKIFGRTSFRFLLIDIIFPASSPAVLSGIRTAIGQSITLVIASELFGISGIGQRMWEASGLVQMDIVLAYMMLIGICYLVFDQIFNLMERRLFKWRKIIY